MNTLKNLNHTSVAHGKVFQMNGILQNAFEAESFLRTYKRAAQNIHHIFHVGYG